MLPPPQRPGSRTVSDRHLQSLAEGEGWGPLICTVIEASRAGIMPLLTRDCQVVDTCLLSDMVESALWKQYLAYRVSKSRGVLYHRQAYNAQCFQMPDQPALWKTFMGLTVCHVSKSRGVLYRTQACTYSGGSCLQKPNS
jgi:hypothetical protein